MDAGTRRLPWTDPDPGGENTGAKWSPWCWQADSSHWSARPSDLRSCWVRHRSIVECEIAERATLPPQRLRNGGPRSNDSNGEWRCSRRRSMSTTRLRVATKARECEGTASVAWQRRRGRAIRACEAVLRTDGRGGRGRTSRSRRALHGGDRSTSRRAGWSHRTHSQPAQSVRAILTNRSSRGGRPERPRALCRRRDIPPPSSENIIAPGGRGLPVGATRTAASRPDRPAT